MIGAFTLVAIGAGVFMARFPGRDARSGRLYDLRNGTTEVRQRAAEELGTGNDDDAAPIFSGLIAALGDDDAGVRAGPRIRWGGTSSSIRRPRRAGEAREALVRSLGDRDGSVRGSSAIALALIGHDPEALILRPGRRTPRRRSDPSRRGRRLPFDDRREGRLRGYARLLVHLRDDSPAVRDAVAHALAPITPGPDPQGRTKILIDALADGNPHARRVVATALGKAGRGRPEAPRLPRPDALGRGRDGTRRGGRGAGGVRR